MQVPCSCRYPGHVGVPEQGVGRSRGERGGGVRGVGERGA